MKQTTKVFSQRRKAVEAKSRRKVTMAWERKSKTLRYRTMAAKTLCRQAMTELKEELFDGILLCLKGINDKKSYPAQKRLVRRIVEKRMAQAVHHAMGHERGYVSTRQVVKYSSWCMREFHGHCTCSVDNNL